LLDLQEQRRSAGGAGPAEGVEGGGSWGRRESEGGGSQRTERVESRGVARPMGWGKGARAGSRNSRGGRRAALEEEGVADAVLAEAASVRQVSGSLLGGDSEGVAERIRWVTGASHALDPGRSGSVRQNLRFHPNPHLHGIFSWGWLHPSSTCIQTSKKRVGPNRVGPSIPTKHTVSHPVLCLCLCLLRPRRCSPEQSRHCRDWGRRPLHHRRPARSPLRTIFEPKNRT
jgi:hypothetical protein